MNYNIYFKLVFKMKIQKKSTIPKSKVEKASKQCFN